MLPRPLSRSLAPLTAPGSLLVLLALFAAGPGVAAAAPLPPQGDPAASETAAAPPQNPETPRAAEANPAAETGKGQEAGQEEGQETTKPEPKPGDLGWHPQPPDGVWLRDEKGWEYYVETLPKEGLVWQRLGEDRVRISWGFTLHLVDEDEDYFYYKVYRTDNIHVEPIKKPMTAEEKAAVAATYKLPATEPVDRLTLEPFSEGLPQFGQWRHGFVIADINEDGQLDIVHGPPRKAPGPPVVFLGDAKGHWHRWTEVRFPPIPLDYGDVAVADFNGDGHPDLAVTSHLRGMVAMVGDGQGHFEPWTQGIDFRVARPGDVGGFSSRRVQIIDWNRDGRPDLLALGEGPRLQRGRDQNTDVNPGTEGPVVYLNQGDGTWVRHDQGTQAGTIFGDSLAVGDFNGDGHPDFATGSSIMGRRDILHLGRADGSWEIVEMDQVRPHGYVRAVRAADFDSDGRDDLAVAYLAYEGEQWRAGIDLFLSRSGESWERRPVTMRESREGFYALGVGDLDGDGHLDLTALSSIGETWIFLGDGKGGFAREESPEIPDVEGSCRGYDVETADLDGDGRQELVTAFAGDPEALFYTVPCSSGGALRAWRPVPKTAPETATPAGGG